MRVSGLNGVHVFVYSFLRIYEQAQMSILSGMRDVPDDRQATERVSS
ncbi:MAG: hypothetical protein MAG453_01383 [Calditrichaeota bacterium]|nr:hypothetical protein [Calditrichota bacterium]